MAIYSYVCDNDHETEITLSMEDTHPNFILCEICRKKAMRNYLSSSIIIPEHFKAQSDICGGDSFASSSNLKNTFSHASRPSGKTGKIYY